VEVMGRESGYIALMGGLAGGAEIILLPEIPVSLDEIADAVQRGIQLGKRHSIIVVAEGFARRGAAPYSGSAARRICDRLEDLKTLETRLTILGHLQRGGSPTAFDRILANRFGQAAVQAFAEGTTSAMLVYDGRALQAVPYSTLDEPCTNVDPKILELAEIVAS
jgi:6-phosphofructokinase 1